MGHGRGGRVLRKGAENEHPVVLRRSKREGIVFCESLVRPILVCYLETLHSHGKRKVGRTEKSIEERHSDGCAVVYE